VRRACLALALVAAWGSGGVAWAGRAVVDWQERYVNVRAAPDLTGKKVGRLARGAEAEVLEERGEWVRVRHAGGEGWVVDRSLRRLPEPSPAVPVPVPVSGGGEAAAAEPAPTVIVSAPAPGPAPAPEVAAAAEPAAAPEPLPVQPPPVQAEPPKPEPAPAAPAPSAPPPAPPAEVAPGAAPGRGGYLTDLDETRLPTYEPGSGLVSMLAGLLLVLALLAGLVWLVRRLSGGRLLLGGRRASPIHVLATRPVGPRQGLLLVEVGGAVWLLSQGPEGLRLVAEVRDEAALARLNQQYGFRETPFEATLRSRLDLESGGGPASAEPPGGSGPEPRPGQPSAEERLAALRRRPPTGGPS